MQIQNINFANFSKLNNQNYNNKQINQQTQNQQIYATSLYNVPKATIPLNYKFNTKISFGEFFDPNRTVPHIDYEEYRAMNNYTKKRFRKRYEKFFNDPTINKKELVDSKFKYMPLQTERSMDEFLKIAKMYAKYKEQPIICLERSPKWFLNAALWMKDGIDNYTFVAFSKNWYRPDPIEGAHRMQISAPTEKEEAAYRKYLKRIKADPLHIVKHFEETGKKTVITDYICSGKGICSFLEIMSNYADDLGILEKFSKSIQIVGIGSYDYMEELNPYADIIETPKAMLPEKLIPYKKDIKQEFYDMDYNMFREMLINQNTNECRSTYFPHETWTVYNPDRFKTGLVTDIKKVKSKLKELKESGEKSMSSFSPAMYDFRNLLNFRILDGLNERGLLKDKHKSKV